MEDQDLEGRLWRIRHKILSIGNLLIEKEAEDGEASKYFGIGLVLEECAQGLADLSEVAVSLEGVSRDREGSGFK